jgi:putative NIF3 family GTP cyclohydrolase 1 type 2
MSLSDFYKLVLKFGIQNDPRGPKGVTAFEDTALLHGDPAVEVTKLLVGIDIDVGELLVADRLRQKDGLDLVIAHHPEGQAWARFYEVMRLQAVLLKKAGISGKVAEEFLEERMREVERRVIAGNHMQTVDIARLLNIAFMCIHTPADNHVYAFMRQVMQGARPKKLSDVLNLLLEIPEYKYAAQNYAGPRIILGSPNRPAGKILVEMTGGTEGSKEMIPKLYKAGVRTILCMHQSEEHFKKSKDSDINVVIAGHISSDTLGLNLLLDNIEKYSAERFEIVACSGFKRISRN